MHGVHGLQCMECMECMECMDFNAWCAWGSMHCCARGQQRMCTDHVHMGRGTCSSDVQVMGLMQVAPGSLHFVPGSYRGGWAVGVIWDGGRCPSS
jgi:hypothetical protein